MNIWIAHADPAINGENFKTRLLTEYKNTMNAVLMQHGMRIDKVNVLYATSEEVQMSF